MTNPDLESRLTRVLADEAQHVGCHGGSSSAVMAKARRRQQQRLAGGGLAAMLLVVGLGSFVVSQNNAKPVELLVADPPNSTIAATDTSVPDEAPPTTTRAETRDIAIVPDLAGLSEVDSDAVLAGTPFKVFKQYLELTPGDARIGFVTNQTPAPGTDLAVGKVLTLAIGRDSSSATTIEPSGSTTTAEAVEKIDIAVLRGLDWESWLQTTPEINHRPDLGIDSNRPDYYEVYDGGGHALIEDVVYGDFDGDGAEDAIIPLESSDNPRGAGGLVYRATHEGPEFIADAEFYNSFGFAAWPTIRDGKIVIESMTGVASEASQGFVTATWRLIDGDLVEIDRLETGIPEMREGTIERFYLLVNAGDLNAAYNLLSPSFQARQPIGEWKAGFADTVSVSVIVGPERATNQFEVEIVAVDRYPDRGVDVTTTFAGTWTLAYSTEVHQWLLDSSSIRETTAATTATTAPESATRTTGTSGGSASFETPSGNISCVLGAGASCFIAETTWEIDEPADCDGGDYGNGVFLTATGADFGCYTDVWWDLDAETISYGSTVTAGSFSCSIRNSGVTCTNASGSGFTVSRTAVDLFDAATLSVDRWADVTIGMTAAELADRGFGSPDNSGVFGECGYVAHLTDSAAPAGMTWDGVLVRLDADRTLRDPGGLGFGSSDDDVLNAYPTATVSDHPYGGPTDGWKYIEVIDPTDPTRGTIFETDGSTVTSWRTGLIENVRWIEGCA